MNNNFMLPPPLTIQEQKVEHLCIACRLFVATKIGPHCQICAEDAYLTAQQITASIRQYESHFNIEFRQTKTKGEWVAKLADKLPDMPNPSGMQYCEEDYDETSDTIPYIPTIPVPYSRDE